MPGEPAAKKACRHADAFAEAIADGVPATTCTRLRDNALCEAGVIKSSKETKNNVARDAYRFMRRLGSRWKISTDTYIFPCPDGSVLHIPYLNPANVFEYLLVHHPVLLHGRHDHDKGCEALAIFWHCYKQVHPSHEVFSKFSQEQLRRVVPINIHGDEGRGKRRSNTTICSFEAMIGWTGEISVCSKCNPVHAVAPSVNMPLTAKHLKSNMKGHSYLQRWLLFVLPGVLWKNYKALTCELLVAMSKHFYDLFHTGVTFQQNQWHMAAIGAKGDLKWFGAICHLTRGYEMKGTKQDIECCHVCLAGGPGLPAEDLTDRPCWLNTLYMSRPWSNTNPPALIDVPFDSSKPEAFYRHDVFHTLRLGVYRDFCGSTIFLFIRWGLYGRDGTVDVKLERVYGHFKLWLSTEGKSASLRSFTQRLFMYKSKKTFPWMNIKGSDVTLVLKFLSVATMGFLNGEPSLTPEQRRVLWTISSSTRLAVRFFDILYDHGIWLDRPCGANLYEVGTAFCTGYVLLADYAFQACECLYSLKPKIHFHKHVLIDLKTQIDDGCDAILSPVSFDCQQNEDYIGRLCKLSRQVHSSTLMTRTIEFYLVKVAILSKRHLAPNLRARQ